MSLSTYLLAILSAFLKGDLVTEASQDQSGLVPPLVPTTRAHTATLGTHVSRTLAGYVCRVKETRGP